MDTDMETIPSEWKPLWDWGVAHAKTVRRYRQILNNKLKERIPLRFQLVSSLI